MINPASQPSDQLNQFTRLVLMMINEKWFNQYWVKLRNGDYVRPVLYEVPKDMIGLEKEHFYVFNSSKSGYRWNLDGTGIQNSSFDMVELVRA